MLEKKPSLLRKGLDGKKYNVFSEVSVSELTSKLLPGSYLREYWIPEKETQATFYLCDRVGQRLSEEIFVELTNSEVESMQTYRYAILTPKK